VIVDPSCAACNLGRLHLNLSGYEGEVNALTECFGQELIIIFHKKEEELIIIWEVISGNQIDLGSISSGILDLVGFTY
jgi:hypothetical protein